jgi:predicted DNA-binding helix-hairpin-helix protein
VNTAGKRELLRVPGLGVRIVNRILSTRRQRRLRFADLKAMGASLRRARFFLVTADYRPANDAQASERLRMRLTPGAVQQELF